MWMMATRLELTESQARDILIAYLQGTVLGSGNFVCGLKLCTRIDDHVVEIGGATDIQRVAEVLLKMI